ncbi:FHA domain-containing protein [Actinoplanes solisilvae]|uniref:FHA domain-containing protein n=1 Tax=Actinoplanes solisilvae TaxID=2486853 RepID=UPI000FDC980B|nr:FHA domain-containing protein [Actinoplanes solisilvae]
MTGHLEVHEGGRVRLVTLAGDLLSIGRAPANEVAIAGHRVSRLHAVLERFPSGWSIRDLGSTNGTTVNGVPLRQARTLHDGDRIDVGPARLLFRSPAAEPSTETVTVEPAPPPPALTRREQDVLAALCRPLTAAGQAFPEPPSVRELAAALGLSDSAVKKHLTNLYDKFGLVTNDERRRPRLASEAVRRGQAAHFSSSASRD